MIHHAQREGKHATNVGNQTKSRVSQMETDDDSDYAFNITAEEMNPKIAVQLGGVSVDMMVDSGASVNVIDAATWKILKNEKIVCSSKAGGGKKLYAYASKDPLPVVGTFHCRASVGEKSTETEVTVIEGRGTPLLGRETATNLGVLKIGTDIAAVANELSLAEKYPSVFTGIGKIKNRQVKLHIDESVTPVAQPLRRTPYQLREKVENKIQELLQADIIEPVNGPTPWVNPIVVVPKKNNDIRICIDMRRANEAIVRARHPIPTVEDVLQDINGSKIFTKLDLRAGYHQCELDEPSREITTFSTHIGLFRYKRLLFGVKSAAEQYQYEIQTALMGIEGAQNISDDIIVHAADKETHDRRLEDVLNRLQECGLTLNSEKCQFNMDRLIFMGLLLSEKGICPTEERVKAIQEAREPTTATETRSFLGLAGFSSRFIPNFATLVEPLRKLTRQNVKFHFGPEQKKAFKNLKESMMASKNLAYFDKNANTKVIADASPVGLGAVLTQEQAGGPVIICYASRGLSDCERRYSQTEKEALALVWACERFHSYIYGVKFDLVTHHKPLEVIYSARSKPSARIERWVLRLQRMSSRSCTSPVLKTLLTHCHV